MIQLINLQQHCHDITDQRRTFSDFDEVVFGDYEEVDEVLR